MNRKLRRAVGERAGWRCEYCKVHESCLIEPVNTDHVIASKHRGATALDNLALACAACNRHKGSNIASRDPVSGKLVPLFNPRKHHWNRHFSTRGAQIVGKTAIGRATVEVLCFNSPLYVSLRSSLIEESAWPPK